MSVTTFYELALIGVATILGFLGALFIAIILVVEYGADENGVSVWKYQIIKTGKEIE